MTSSPTDKKKARRLGLLARGEIDRIEYAARERCIAEKICRCTEYAEAELVLLYAAYKTEMPTEQIEAEALSAGKKVAYPKVRDDGMMDFYAVSSHLELTEGYKGIKEPDTSDFSKAEKLTDEKLGEYRNIFMIVPGAAFDRAGHRVGYGKGYYDRYLGSRASRNDNQNTTGNGGYRITTCGICFKEQLFDCILTEAHDICMDIVIYDAE